VDLKFAMPDLLVVSLLSLSPYFWFPQISPINLVPQLGFG
jgi:hypothetical protein